MESNRREFIRNLGVLLASLLTSGCQVTTTCYEVAMVTDTPAPGQDSTPAPAGGWQTLRACWLDLRSSQLQSFDETDFSKALRQRHAQALDELVASGELPAGVAAEIQMAFEQAIAHVQRQMATCYIALPPEYTPRQDLMEQAAALTDMAAASDVDPDTVARARAALERDLAWLSQFSAGQRPGELDDVVATPEAIEAARILVGLLLEQ